MVEGYRDIRSQSNLTRSEWLVLDEFLELGENCHDVWTKENSFDKKWELLDLARNKVKNVANSLK